MTKEQTQAEKLASEFMAKLTVYAPSKADPIDELHWTEAENWLAQAINQATAELREENEQLKAQNGMLLEELESEKQAKINTIEQQKAYIQEISKPIDEKLIPLNTRLCQTEALLSRVKSERDQAQAKVAALVDVAEDLFQAWPAPDKYPQWFLEVVIARLNAIEKAVKNTQATADEYTAKVRRDVIEETVKRAKELSFFTRIESNTTQNHYYVVTVEDLLSLLPEPAASAEKGGAL